MTFKEKKTNNDNILQIKMIEVQQTPKMHQKMRWLGIKMALNLA